MLIVNYQKLDPVALTDDKHPMHIYAKEYDDGIRRLRKMYPEGAITLKQAGFPKRVDMIDGKGREFRDVPDTVPPIQISLLANHVHPERGKEHWGVCLGTPKPKEGGLWDIGSKRKIQMDDKLIVNLMKEPELAFFLYYKSPQVLGGHLKIDDPRADAREKGNRKREALELETAIWQTLADEAQLKKVAQGWGIANVNKKEPDTIRFELEALLNDNNDKKRRDPSVRGTKEFLEDLKITSYMRLSAFVRDRIDEGFIRWSPDGKFKVGDKIVAHVKPEDSNPDKRFKVIVNYLAAPNNEDKVQQLMRDTVDRKYLDSITDPKDFRWLADCMKIEGYYTKSAEQVKEMVYAEFNV